MIAQAPVLKYKNKQWNYEFRYQFVTIRVDLIKKIDADRGLSDKQSC